jgi:hypothetical protein
MNIQAMTDDELRNVRTNMPKYLNDMTDEQKELSRTVYAEQKKRYDVNLEKEYREYNDQVEKAGYKIGDKVSYFARLMLGIGGVVVKGTVAKRKKYYVKLDVEFNGKKTAHLTNAWKINSL